MAPMLKPMLMYALAFYMGPLVAMARMARTITGMAQTPQQMSVTLESTRAVIVTQVWSSTGSAMQGYY